MSRPMSTAVALLLAAFVAVAPVAAQEKLSPTQRKEVEALIQETIRNNPEIVLDALRSLEARQKQAQAKRSLDTIRSESRALRENPSDHVLGNPKGDVTVVEFFDYRCSYCKQAAPRVKDLIKGDPKVKVVLKELPILGPESLLASRAAIASREQGKYGPFHDALMAARRLDEASILQIAAEIGLDLKKLRADMDSPKVEAIIRANHQLAEQLGINGTPAFIIGDNLVPGAIPTDQMKALVTEARTGCVTC